MPRAHQRPISRREVQTGMRVSGLSLVWTLATGAGAIALGLVGNSIVLVVFGVIGLLDAAGSASLVVHFWHALHHEKISERHEELVLRIVTLGMGATGFATIVDSAYRLSVHTSSESVAPGVILAGASVLVLAVLARAKRNIAAQIPSHALHADGWLSAVGATLALVAVAGTGLATGFGWWWADPVAAIGVACGAIGLSLSLALAGAFR